MQEIMAMDPSKKSLIVKYKICRARPPRESVLEPARHPLERDEATRQDGKDRSAMAMKCSATPRRT